MLQSKPLKRALAALVICLVVIFGSIGPATAAPKKTTYVVRLKPSTNLARFISLEVKRGTNLTEIFTAVFPGFSSKLTASQVARLKADKGVLSVSNLTSFSTPKKPSSVQSEANWGLDRIDQRQLPLDGRFSSGLRGKGVAVYVFDSGLDSAHREFAGRIQKGFSAIGSASDTSDCNGHGTHVAGTIAGTSVGVAPEATVIPVRVMDCKGRGDTLTILRGINWAISDHASRGGPAVANLSLGYAGPQPDVDAAIQSMIASGISVVVAAGNSSTNACFGSPARVASAITVAATGRVDVQSPFSNYGNCVDVFAPGQDIRSSWLFGGYRSLDGTSMAAPHVAGVAALALEENPAFSPSKVTSWILASSTRNVLKGVASRTPNLLLFSSGPNSSPSTPSTTVAPVSSTSTTVVRVSNLALSAEKFTALNGSTISSITLTGSSASDNQLWWTVTVTDPLGRLVRSGSQLCPVASKYPFGDFCTGAGESGDGDRFKRVYGGLYWVSPQAPGGTWVVRFDPVPGGASVSGNVTLTVRPRTTSTTVAPVLTTSTTVAPVSSTSTTVAPVSSTSTTVAPVSSTSTTVVRVSNLALSAEKFTALNGSTISSITLTGSSASDNQLWWTVTVTDPLGRLVRSGSQLCPVASKYPFGDFCTGAGESGDGDRFKRVYGGLYWVSPQAPGGTWVVRFDPVPGDASVSGNVTLTVRPKS